MRKLYTGKSQTRLATYFRTLTQFLIRSLFI